MHGGRLQDSVPLRLPQCPGPLMFGGHGAQQELIQSSRPQQRCINKVRPGGGCHNVHSRPVRTHAEVQGPQKYQGLMSAVAT